MAVLDTRTFETPNEVLSFDRARMELVEAGDVRVWRCTFDPGWRYTEHMDSESCPAPHAAYIASGRLGIEMDDGAQAEAGPGEVVVIEPGHDAWTVGDEPCVFIDFGESASKSAAGE